MASRIQGITVEIGGDTTKLQNEDKKMQMIDLIGLIFCRIFLVLQKLRII